MRIRLGRELQWWNVHIAERRKADCSPSRGYDVES